MAAPKRYCFLRDDSCHNYLVPLEDKEAFEAWVDSYENEDYGAGAQIEDIRFNAMRIDGINGYSFTDPKATR